MDNKNSKNFRWIDYLIILSLIYVIVLRVLQIIVFLKLLNQPNVISSVVYTLMMLPVALVIINLVLIYFIYIAKRWAYIVTAIFYIWISNFKNVSLKNITLTVVIYIIIYIILVFGSLSRYYKLKSSDLPKK